MARIAIIGTGGTISNAGVDPLDALEYVDRGEVLPIEDALARFPLLARIADVETIPFATRSSRAIGTSDWVALRGVVTATIARDDIDGVVVTHGTATLEETAYFLTLTVPSHKPLVVVGAQRPATTVGSDTYSNLIAALRVASSSHAAGHGCLVVMNDRIESAREVTKTSNHHLDAMRSPGLGPLGWVDPDGEVRLSRRTLRHHTLESMFAKDELWASATDLPRVDITLAHGGSDGADVSAYLARGTDGIVVAALAPGVLPPAHEAELLAARAAGVPLVLASRAMMGRTVTRRTSPFPGVPTANSLSPQSARVLLLIALVARVPHLGLQGVFDTH
jgi:L-asparaginase